MKGVRVQAAAWDSAKLLNWTIRRAWAAGVALCGLGRISGSRRRG